MISPAPLGGGGGIIGDDIGLWLAGFAANVGICSSYRGEVWAAYLGLDLLLTRI